MQFEESKAARSFVGRIDPGDDVLEALTLLCTANDIRAAEVRIAGTVRDFEVVRLNAKSREYETYLAHDGVADVVHFTGNLASLGGQPVFRAEAMLAVDGAVGQQFVYGQLRRAAAVDCEFIVHDFSDLEIRRILDPQTGRFPIAQVMRVGGEVAAPPATTPAPTPPAVARRAAVPETISEPALGRGAPPVRPEQPAPSPRVEPQPSASTSAMSWDDAVTAAEELKPARNRQGKPMPRRPASTPDAAEVYGDYDDDQPLPGPGDILDHPKLGECRVIKVEDDEYAHIRLSRGQIRKLALQFVELIHQGERDGKNVFKVRVNK